jgi:hypothetical protein
MAEGDLRSVRVDFMTNYDCSRGMTGNIDHGVAGTVDLMYNGMSHQRKVRYGLSSPPLPDSLNNGIMFR